MRWREWREYPEYAPPRHFHCRSTFVKIADGTPEEKIEAPNHEAIKNIDHITTTKKDDLIKENPLVAQYTKAELTSIEAYKGNGYININQALLGNRPMNEYALANIKQLDKAIKKTTLGEDTVLYRGVGLKKQLKLGETISQPNYTSTSFNIDVAWDFAKKSDGYRYLLEFTAPKNMPYLDVEGVMLNNNITTITENEYLLSRDKKFIVKSFQKWDNEVTKVILEMTEDTKYLNDGLDTNGFRELTSEEVERREEARLKLEVKQKAGVDSGSVRRLHHIWQMDSDYLNKQREKSE